MLVLYILFKFKYHMLVCLLLCICLFFCMRALAKVCVAAASAITFPDFFYFPILNQIISIFRYMFHSALPLLENIILVLEMFPYLFVILSRNEFMFKISKYSCHRAESFYLMSINYIFLPQCGQCLICSFLASIWRTAYARECFLLSLFS